MKNQIPEVLAGLLLLCATLLTGTEAVASPQILTLLTWADYLDPGVVKEFEHEQHAAIKFAFYASDDHRDELLATSDASGYDLVLINGLMVGPYSHRDWLAPIPLAQIPNLMHIDDRWRDAFPGTARFAVPYFWGTLGIGYRRDLVPEGFKSWKDFFSPADSLRGRITMLKSSRDVVGMALKSLGHSANAADRSAIREAGRLLEAQKPYVRSYEYVELDEKSALVTGEVWASLMYSGDALMLQEYHPDIVYVVPREGGNLWIDYLVILRSSTQKALAAKFIDFLNRPEIAARNAKFVNYATPNTAARPYLPKEYFDNPVIYPDQAVLSRSEIYHELAPRAQKTLNTVYGQLVN